MKCNSKVVNSKMDMEVFLISLLKIIKEMTGMEKSQIICGIVVKTKTLGKDSTQDK